MDLPGPPGSRLHPGRGIDISDMLLHREGSTRKNQERDLPGTATLKPLQPRMNANADWHRFAEL